MLAHDEVKVGVDEIKPLGWDAKSFRKGSDFRRRKGFWREIPGCYLVISIVEGIL